MNIEEFDILRNIIQNKCAHVANSKRAAYTNDEKDVLTNFKIIASIIGNRPIDVWAVYFLKHVIAINTYIKSGVTSEGVDNNIIDAINFLELGYALLNEEGKV